MAIAYIYYNNSMKYVTAYWWEPQKETRRFILQPYKNLDNVFACKEVCINLEQLEIVVDIDGCKQVSKLQDPKKDINNLKHQAHFDDTDQGEWDDYLIAGGTDV